MDATSLAALDAAGYAEIEALTPERAPSQNSGFTPHCFVCVDGNKYWVKHSAQQGLVAELVAGRLAARLGAGPMAEIIRVPAEAVEGKAELQPYIGLHVGTLDAPDTANAKDFGALGIGTISVDAIPAEDRALVVAFQTWIAASDSQVLVDFARRRLYSIDHGDVFGAIGSMVAPTPVITQIPGVDGSHGCDGACIESAVSRIESLSDDDLLRSVAGIPDDAKWRADAARRLEMARWLGQRRDGLREAMKQWK